MERTLSIIKPDGVRKNLIGEVCKRFEDAGLKIAAMKKVRMTTAQAQGFYAVAIALNRKLMGATNPEEAEAGTIRADFADNIQNNIVHGSDAPDTAAFEVSYFFAQSEIF